MAHRFTSYLVGVAILILAGCGSDGGPADPGGGGGPDPNPDAVFVQGFESGIGQWTNLPLNRVLTDTTAWEDQRPSLGCTLHFLESYRDAAIIGRSANYARTGSFSLLIDYQLDYMLSLNLSGSCNYDEDGYYVPDPISANYLGPPVDVSHADFGDTVRVSFWVLPLELTDDDWGKNEFYFRVGPYSAGFRFEPTEAYFAAHQGQWQKVEFDISSYAGVWDTLAMGLFLKPAGVDYDHYRSSTFQQEDEGGRVAIRFAMDDLVLTLVSQGEG